MTSLKDLSPRDFWKAIGSPRLCCAPMVDGSELPFRLLCREYGTQLAWTPMFGAASFAQSATYRDTHFQPCAYDRPLIVQFCANDPEALVTAAQYVVPYCDAVDLNLGCPQNIARRGRYGAFLMDDVPLVCSLIRNAKRKLGVHVTAKIRCFNSLSDTITYAKAVVAAGASVLSVHGRTREMRGVEPGVADWAYIAAVVRAVGKHVPVIANGNIFTPADARACLAATGADAVMSAEALLWEPRLFHPPARFLVSGRQALLHGPRVLDGASVCKRYLALAAQWPKETTLSIIRGHILKALFHTMGAGGRTVGVVAAVLGEGFQSLGAATTPQGGGGGDGEGARGESSWAFTFATPPDGFDDGAFAARDEVACGAGAADSSSNSTAIAAGGVAVSPHVVGGRIEECGVAGWCGWAHPSDDCVVSCGAVDPWAVAECDLAAVIDAAEELEAKARDGRLGAEGDDEPVCVKVARLASSASHCRLPTGSKAIACTSPVTSPALPSHPFPPPVRRRLVTPHALAWDAAHKDTSSALSSAPLASRTAADVAAVVAYSTRTIASSVGVVCSRAVSASPAGGAVDVATDAVAAVAAAAQLSSSTSAVVYVGAPSYLSLLPPPPLSVPPLWACVENLMNARQSLRPPFSDTAPASAASSAAAAGTDSFGEDHVGSEWCDWAIEKSLRAYAEAGRVLGVMQLHDTTAALPTTAGSAASTAHDTLSAHRTLASRPPTSAAPIASPLHVRDISDSLPRPLLDMPVCPLSFPPTVGSSRSSRKPRAAGRMDAETHMSAALGGGVDAPGGGGVAPPPLKNEGEEASCGEGCAAATQGGKGGEDRGGDAVHLPSGANWATSWPPIPPSVVTAITIGGPRVAAAAVMIRALAVWTAGKREALEDGEGVGGSGGAAGAAGGAVPRRERWAEGLEGRCYRPSGLDMAVAAILLGIQPMQQLMASAGAVDMEYCVEAVRILAEADPLGAFDGVVVTAAAPTLPLREYGPFAAIYHRAIEEMGGKKAKNGGATVAAAKEKVDDGPPPDYGFDLGL